MKRWFLQYKKAIQTFLFNGGARSEVTALHVAIVFNILLLITYPDTTLPIKRDLKPELYLYQTTFGTSLCLELVTSGKEVLFS